MRSLKDVAERCSTCGASRDQHEHRAAADAIDDLISEVLSLHATLREG